MNKVFLSGVLILCLSINIAVAQTVDLTSVDEFFKVTSILKEKKEIPDEQWNDFANSSAYKDFAEREDQTLINIIKSSINIVFGNESTAEKDSILNITQEEMDNNTMLLVKKLILVNYLDMNDHYASIKSFRDSYDFNALIEKAKQRLASFFGKPIDSTTEFKPVYFLCITADGGVQWNGIFIDLNLIFNKTEEQRVDFLAHEFFHDYRERCVNDDYYKNDLAYIIDAIQDEGIADLIDKAEGYRKYFTDMGELPEMIESWVRLYNQAQEDLERLQDLSIQYAKNKISKNDLADEIEKIVRYRGHPIGFFMANQIVSAGYKSEMLKTFYNPYEFYSLYNKAAKKQNLFQLSNEFMDYLKSLTKEYYR